MIKQLDMYLCKAVGELSAALKTAHLMEDPDLYEELYKLRKDIGEIRDEHCSTTNDD